MEMAEILVAACLRPSRLHLFYTLRTDWDFCNLSYISYIQRPALIAKRFARRA